MRLKEKNEILEKENRELLIALNGMISSLETTSQAFTRGQAIDETHNKLLMDSFKIGKAVLLKYKKEQ